MTRHQRLRFRQPNKSSINNEVLRSMPSIFNNKTESKSQGKLLIGNALDRHQISTGYHYNAYPSFMKSHGPFKIYDHSHVKGSQQKIDEINHLAQQRFQQELKSIKNLRDFERKQFYSTKDKLDEVAAFKARVWKENQNNNLEMIKKQIEYKDSVKSENYRVEKLYYKPHFGPEETEEAVALEVERKLN